MKKRQDANECRLTGTIERTRKITTKTNTAMAEIILTVRRDQFRVVAHGNVAEHILERGKAKDRLSITGTLTVSSWKDETTGKRGNSFSVTAWGVELHGDKVAFQRKQKAALAGGRQRCEPPTTQPGDFFLTQMRKN